MASKKKRENTAAAPPLPQDSKDLCVKRVELKLVGAFEGLGIHL